MRVREKKIAAKRITRDGEGDKGSETQRNREIDRRTNRGRERKGSWRDKIAQPTEIGEKGKDTLNDS